MIQSTPSMANVVAIVAITAFSNSFTCHAFQRHHNAIRRPPPALREAVDPIEVSDKNFDLCVIGAGPVGVNAALKAARAPYNKNVILIDAPRASGALMNEANGEDLSIGGPTGLFSKALRDVGKRISVSSLKGMGLRDDRYVSFWLCASRAHDMSVPFTVHSEEMRVHNDQ